MEGLIITGGKGTRMRDITYVVPKSMLPLFGISNDGNRVIRPLIDFMFDRFINLGIEKITIVFSKYSQLLIDYLNSKTSLPDIKLSFVLDRQILGYGNAVLLAKHLIREDFLMTADDNLFSHATMQLAKRYFDSKKPDALLLVYRVENPTRYGVIEAKKLGAFEEHNVFKVKRAVEKPENPPSNLAISAVYFFSPKIFEALEIVNSLYKGAGFEFTEGIQKLIEMGGDVRALETKEKWLNVGKPDHYIEALNATWNLTFK